MKTFALVLQDGTRSERIEDVTAFIGEDDSGSFGILAHHARFMTTLVMGLARYCVGGHWRYLAMPGAVLYFLDNTLILNTRRYLQDDDYNRISAALQEQLLAEEDLLQATKVSLRRMEEEVLRRMWELARRAG
jgi:F-type H+-transporting ATPase subunit epsilon